MKTVGIILPVHNESENIKLLIKSIKEDMPKTVRAKIFFVDDGSTDETWNTICEFEDISAVKLSRNFGKDAAIRAGLRCVTDCDAAIIMDGDLQHPTEMLPELIRVWGDGKVEIVEAIKRNRGKESLAYKIFSNIFFKVFGLFSGIDIKNKTDFCLIDKKVIKELDILTENNLFFRGMLSWIGFKRAYLYFDVLPRYKGDTSWKRFQLLKWSINNITSFSALPLHIITIMGLLFLTLGLIVGTRISILKFQGRVIDGFTTLILLTIIIGSFIMIALGIVGAYLAKIYAEVKQRPPYIVNDIKKERIAENINKRTNLPGAGI